MRNLLHDQVKDPGTQEVAARWNELIEREEEFRHAHGRLPSLQALAPAMAFG